MALGRKLSEAGRSLVACFLLLKIHFNFLNVTWYEFHGPDLPFLDKAFLPNNPMLLVHALETINMFPIFKIELVTA